MFFQFYYSQKQKNRFNYETVLNLLEREGIIFSLLL